MAARRRGILGGTFDPPHYGHLAIAEQVHEQLGLDGVLFMPAAQPPHKPGRRISAPEHRLAMVELAIADNAHFGLLRDEIDRGGMSYSVDSLEQLSARRPGEEFVFIVSAEAARQLPTWRDPRRLLELAEMAVVPRLGYPGLEPDWTAQHFAGLEHRFIAIASASLGHSATTIRARAAAGRTIRYLVPPAVEDYIERYGLYR